MSGSFGLGTVGTPVHRFKCVVRPRDTWKHSACTWTARTVGVLGAPE
jgi:hypothetical protein